MMLYIEVVVMEDCMGEKQWKGYGPCHFRCSLFGGFQAHPVQFLEGAKHINVEWLLEVRLLLAGYIDDRTCLYAGMVSVFSLSLQNPKDIGKLLVFGILGMLLAPRYSYFESIAISESVLLRSFNMLRLKLIIIYLFEIL